MHRFNMSISLKLIVFKLFHKSKEEFERKFFQLDSLFVQSEGGWKWIGDEGLNFSVKGLRRLIQEAAGSVADWKYRRWKGVPGKVNLLAWRVLLDRIPSKIQLQKRNVPLVDLWCPFCGDAEETSEHIFSGCSFSCYVWSVIEQWVKAPPFLFFSVKDILEDDKDPRKGSKVEQARKVVVLSCVWCLWLERNRIVFKSCLSSRERVLREVKMWSFLWFKFRCNFPLVKWEDWVAFNL
ncbi:hypothetical protein SSX86_017566 [Deinandra increscens subsp. villosa]|uniref:Reverse transcriptase zinc-binding domain-containing protein n=1 Tax=Deinandra increscens subsp. villosa TaxID=3103831 RepID=A0AAP0CVJ0_9ASTR